MFSPSFTASTSFDPSDELYSDHILVELLIIHEQSITQLRRQDPKGITALDLSRNLIDRHEQTAARLRAHLKSLARIPFAGTPTLAGVIQS